MPTPPEFLTETCSIIFQRGALPQIELWEGALLWKIVCEMCLRFTRVYSGRNTCSNKPVIFTYKFFVIVSFRKVMTLVLCSFMLNTSLLLGLSPCRDAESLTLILSFYWVITLPQKSPGNGVLLNMSIVFSLMQESYICCTLCCSFCYFLGCPETKHGVQKLNMGGVFQYWVLIC